MTNVRFYLKEPEAETSTLIYAFFNFSGKRLKISTGEKIHPKLWNTEKERVRFNRAHPEALEINHTLDLYEAKIKTAYRKLIEEGPITQEKLKNQVLVELKKSTQEAGTSFMEFFDLYVTELRKIRPYNSMKKFHTLLTYLKQMQEVQTFSWSEIDIEWFRRFEAFLINEKGFSKNYFGSMVGALKRVLNEATERGLNTNMKYKSKVFKREFEEIPNVFLSLDELDQIFKHDFSENPKLDRVRDRFLIGCYTGMRFSDYSRLSEINFSEGFVIQDMKKETGRVIIPMHPVVKAILQKYNGHLPKAISDQRFNEYLKKMAEAAGIKTKVFITRTTGGVKTTTSFEKWQVITSHTARRTMASNMMLAGIPIFTIMKITGHKSVSQFLKYVKLSEQQVANDLALHPFFQNKTTGSEPVVSDGMKKIQSKKASQK